MSSTPTTIELVEEVLRTEDSCVAVEDVPLLLSAIYAKMGLPVPSEINDEINQYRHNRGDCDEDCVPCGNEEFEDEETDA